MTTSRPRRLFALALAVPVAATVLYFGLLRGNGEAVAQECRAAKPVADRLAPLARGEVAAVKAAQNPARLPNLAFAGPDGKPLTLADFRGRTILVNLWATWCAPCRHEMPALDKLQAELGSPAFEVVAINIDTRNLERPKSWLQEAGVTRLAYYADPQARTFQELRQAGKAVGMPTTFLVDPQGCELAALHGPAEWASEDALRLVRAALGREPR
jgi:thiol-disulfide isomerase/thioredoxin